MTTHASDKFDPDGDESGREGMSRRDMLSCSVATMGLLVPGYALGDDRIEQARIAIARLVGARELKESGITLTTPAIAENGNTVPVSIEVDVSFTPDRYVEAMHLIAEENPAPDVASFFFTPASGKASISTRIRLARTQRVIAIAEISDGRVLGTANEVKVTIGGCGG
jgi:sulfur-oxidizing protein SoxY